MARFQRKSLALAGAIALCAPFIALSSAGAQTAPTAYTAPIASTPPLTYTTTVKSGARLRPPEVVAL